MRLTNDLSCKAFATNILPHSFAQLHEVADMRFHTSSSINGIRLDFNPVASSRLC